MRFYLSSWIGDGTEDNEYRPPLDDEAWAVIDLRPDSTVVDGRCLVATTNAVTAPQGTVDLGDALDAVSVPRRNAIRGALGVDLQATTLRGAIAELLILHGEADLPNRTRWKRLKATHRGRHRIVMLGEALYDAPVVEGAVVTETWAGVADGNTITGDQPWTEVTDTKFIISSERLTTSISGTFRARCDTDLDSDDQYAEFDLLRLTVTDTNRWGPAVRFSSSAETCYITEWWAGGSIAGRLPGMAKVVTGTVTFIANNGTGSVPNDGDRVRFSVDGSALSIERNSVEALSTTDTTITGHLRTGINLGAQGSNRAGVDNFEAGDLAAPSTPFIGFTVTGPPYQVPVP